MKFDFVIGNPPYQEEQEGDNKTFAPPVYHKFIDEAYAVADKVELIHPARFLFNAGSTPKAWNNKMLNDEHLTVLMYEADSVKIFPNADIKGGVAVTYRDSDKKYGAIGTFAAYPELNSIMEKVVLADEFETFKEIVYTRTSYRLTEKLHEDFPDAKNDLSKGHLYDMSTNIFDRLSYVFYDEKPADGKNYVSILGLDGASRITKWIDRDYVKNPKNFEYYKIILPKANGSGAIGEVLSTPLIGEPLIGHTETFISIGSFEIKSEAEAALKYIKTKFARTMLGILKTTQDNPPEKWRFVPLQDFTSSSDIDWSQSVADIDRQLYAKYGLDDSEIEFIETHVKEME